jgi:dTDP-N-acetylfucosamine:lipid II N-acetylfucosaminyltransferase
MNLHLSLDEKFVDFVINDVAKLNLSGQNDFVIYTYDNTPIKYVKSNKVRRIIINSKEWDNLFREELKKYDRIFLHFLDPSLYPLLPLVPSGIKVVWLFFGADAFDLFDGLYFLQPLSRQYYRKIEKENRHKKIKVDLLSFYKRLRLNWKNRRIRRKAFLRIDYFGHFVLEDYSLVKRKFKARFEFLPFTFNSLDALDHDRSGNKLGDNILIGNSASITNNHLEVLEKFKSIGYKDRKIYFPLSYGNKAYCADLEKRAGDLFGGNFVPLKDFIPFDEYKRLLNTCGFVIMNHNRSQGSDNVLICLCNGAKVFMSEESFIYIFFKQIGVKVFSVNKELNDTNSSLFEPLSDEEKKNNERALRNYFGEFAHEQRLQKILSI